MDQMGGISNDDEKWEIMKMMIIVTDSTDKNALKMMRMDLIKMMIVVYSTDRNAMMMMMMIVMMMVMISSCSMYVALTTNHETTTR